MTDRRYTKLAQLLANYSTALKKGDRILLDMIDVSDEFTIELIRAAQAAGLCFSTWLAVAHSASFAGSFCRYCARCGIISNLSIFDFSVGETRFSIVAHAGFGQLKRIVQVLQFLA